jgi:CRP/FNR family transcriptional regulator, anaerobic regulatory protein
MEQPTRTDVTVNDSTPSIRARLIDRTADRPTQMGNLLSRKEQQELRAIAKLVEFPRPGMTIFSRGDDAQFVYVIEEGIVRITRIAANGSRRILAFMVAGDLLGVPDCGSYANSSETVCPTKAYKIPWLQLRQAMAKEPQLQLNLLIKLAHDFRQAQRQMMMLGQQSAHQRLALFLLDFMRNPGFFDEARCLLSLPVNHFDLADYLGTTRETATRAFARLERERLVKRVNSQTLHILDLKRLQMLQHGPPRRRHEARSHSGPAAPL